MSIKKYDDGCIIEYVPEVIEENIKQSQKVQIDEQIIEMIDNQDIQVRYNYENLQKETQITKVKDKYNQTISEGFKHRLEQLKEKVQIYKTEVSKYKGYQNLDFEKNSQQVQQISYIQDKMVSNSLQQQNLNSEDNQLQLNNQVLLKQSINDQQYILANKLIEKSNQEQKFIQLHASSERYNIQNNLIKLEQKIQKIEKNLHNNELILSNETISQRINQLLQHQDQISYKPGQINILSNAIQKYNEKIQKLQNTKSNIPSKEEIYGVLELYDTFISHSSLSNELPKLVEYLQNMKEIFNQSNSFNNQVENELDQHNNLVDNLKNFNENQTKQNQNNNQKINDVINQLNKLEESIKQKI